MYKSYTKDWKVGDNVEVGHVKLVVEKVEVTDRDYELWHLRSAAGDQYYTHTPCMGLESASPPLTDEEYAKAEGLRRNEDLERFIALREQIVEFCIASDAGGVENLRAYGHLKGCLEDLREEIDYQLRVTKENAETINGSGFPVSRRRIKAHLGKPVSLKAFN